MFRGSTMAGLCFLILGLAVRADPPAGGPAKLPAILTKSISVGPFENAELRDVVRVLREKHKCPVTLDDAAFEEQKLKSVAQSKVSLPKFASAPTGLIVAMIARQVDGVIRLHGDQLTLVPGKAPAELKTLVGPLSPKMSATMAQPVNVARPIDGAPIKDVVEFLGIQYGQPIVLDEWGFANVGKEHVGDRQCKLPAGVSTFRKLVDELADSVGGVALVGDEFVLILPSGKGK